MARAPGFWMVEDPTLAARLLDPAGALYDAAVRLRFALARPARAGVPVVCIGNPGLGGAGKTPTAIAIARRLLEMGAAPHLLTRGYGGRLTGPLRVDRALHVADDVGDEALLLAAAAPTTLAADRAAGASAAERDGAGIIVMDDGFQNPTIEKTVSFLVVDALVGIGNGRVFPAGPLREDIARQLARADALILIGEGTAGARVAALAPGLPVLRARLVANHAAPDLAGRAVIAFCGIGRPEKFHASLVTAGARIAAHLDFPDHHAFTPGDVGRVLALATRHPDAQLVCTAKDYVRLGPANDPNGRLRTAAAVLPIEVVFEDTASLDAMLAGALASGRPKA